MKIFNFGNLCLLASLAALSGCLEREFSEAEGIMSVDTRELVVPADMYEGRNLVTDTIFVTSNRSWSAAFESDVDWVKMDTTGHQDMSRISELTPLVFRFKDNEEQAERSVKVKICCADGEKEITLRQEAIKYRLALTSSTDGFESIKSDGDTVKLSFNTNTEWQISLKSGSTAKVTFPVSSGKYTTSDLLALVNENEELITKEAVLVISSPNIPESKWIEVPVGQLEGYPYFRFTDTLEDPQNPAFNALDGVSGLDIGIKTNTSWRAELVSLDGISSIEKKVYDAPSQSWGASGTNAVPGDVVAGGLKTAKTVNLRFPASIRFGSDAKMVLKFIADGIAEPISVTINQKPCVRWWMGVLDDEHVFHATNALGYAASNEMTWGLSFPKSNTNATEGLPTSSGSRNNVGKEVTFITSSGVSFRVYTPYGMWKNSGSGIMIGQGQGTTYIEIPAFEGFAFKKLVVTWRGTSANTFDIQTFDGAETVLAGGSFAQKGVQTEYPVSGTKKNTAYRILSTGTGNIQLGDVIYYYE